MTTATPHRRPQLLHDDTSAAVRVLVVDGEAVPAERLSHALRCEGWDVRAAADGAEAVRCARTFRPDAVVLDARLPGPDGAAALGRLRGELPGVPVLFLAGSGGSGGSGAVSGVVSGGGRVGAGLTAGGDDCVVRPFGVEEVVARLRGLLRRSRTTASRGGAVLTVGDLVLDEDSREVFRGGADIHLTATEFELLRFLMRNPRRVLSKPLILDRVWSYDFGGRVNVVELYISYLRRKIDAGRPPMIHTRRGAGYLIKPAGGE
ncbi:response regulator transcription factor [Streptomyces griseocarneus]|uniref:response regulator transcription factor n=1 Tax=Streptomyces griseocarneus TaxID=51201 RepID=UPI00167E5330|nr:response regulator transcription factor [Streptomyces griseocarneus]MBZ6473115.1 response regulator transcription factor [Streptomyces griseocarneus]GHG59945.1 DNA-binding response regulator [Streptomyces griseocarneus]